MVRYCLRNLLMDRNPTSVTWITTSEYMYPYHYSVDALVKLLPLYSFGQRKNSAISAYFKAVFACSFVVQMIRTLWGRGRRNQGSDRRRRQEVHDNRPIWREHSLSRRRGIRISQHCGVNSGGLSLDRSQGIRRSQSLTPNSRQ
jgi:hypothetical protein